MHRLLYGKSLSSFYCHSLNWILHFESFVLAVKVHFFFFFRETKQLQLYSYILVSRRENVMFTKNLWKKIYIYIFIFRNFHSKQMVRCDDITLCLKQENLNLGEWKFQLTFPNPVSKTVLNRKNFENDWKWWNEFDQWYVQRNNDKREQKIILGKINFSDDIDSLLEDESERMLRKRGCIEACLFHRLALVSK